jgi:hypothetical protein
MNPFLENLSAVCQSGLLSQIQVDLLLARASDWSHWTHQRLISYFQLSGRFASVAKCLFIACLPRGDSTPINLLILDGHPSRLNWEALVILDACDAHVLCLPQRSTHVIQPIDVAITSPLKIYFKQTLNQQLRVIMDANALQREKSSILQ